MKLLVYIAIAFFFCLELNTQFEDPITLATTPLSRMNIFKVADVDNDGLNDIICGKLNTSKDFRVYRNSGSDFNFMTSFDIPLEFQSSQMDFYDLDNDGDLDGIFGGLLYENIDNKFNLKEIPEANQYWQYKVLDINSDGLPELFPFVMSISTYDNSYQYLKCIGPFEYTLIGDPIEDPESVASMHILDVDSNNSKIELFVKGESEGESRLIEIVNDEISITTHYFLASEMTSNDLDGDGTVEIISKLNSANDDAFKINRVIDGEISEPIYFNATDSFNPSALIESIEFYDIDNDGEKEILFVPFSYSYISVRKLVNDEIIELPNLIIPPRPAGLFSLNSTIIKGEGETFFVQQFQNNLGVYDLYETIEGFEFIDEQLLLSPYNSYLLNSNKTSGLNSFHLNRDGFYNINYNREDEEFLTTIIETPELIRLSTLIQLRNENPDYLFSYYGNNGLFVADAFNITNNDLNQALFDFDSTIRIYPNRIDGKAQCLVTAGLDIYRLTYENDEFKRTFLRSMANNPDNIVEVDLNFDGEDDIVWISSGRIWYSAQINGEYQNFVLYYEHPSSLLDLSIFQDVDNDDQIELILSTYSELLIISANNDFSKEIESIEMPGYVIQNTGFLDENNVSLSSRDGHLIEFNDVNAIIQGDAPNFEYQSDLDEAYSINYYDIDTDGDQDIVLYSGYTLMVSFNLEINLSKDTNSNEINAYPNPTNSTLNFVQSDVTILDIKNFQGQSIGKEFSEDLPEGIYYIKVYHSNEEKIIKVIKSK